VFVDGRRATRHRRVRAALGVIAVDIGRPFLWGLGAFGQAGVDRVLEILQGGLDLAIDNCATTVGDITREYVMPNAD
jgi:isopentenyl diphosphate isomerase/L-lactate dehydrogenase-like FMN-dependent dehydrogenase